MIPHLRKLTVVALLALSACGAAPQADAPTQTSVQLGITGGANMNGGAPAKVKVYYLNDTTAFARADFFSLFDQPQETLGDDLIAVDEFQLAPGRNVTDAKTFATAPAAMGVVAAFRDINGRFSASKRLIPNTTNPAQITLSGNSVTIR